MFNKIILTETKRDTVIENKESKIEGTKLF